MKILYLSQVLPYPLDAGPRIRMYYVLRYLSREHQVTLLSFLRSGEEKYLDHLRSFCESVVTVPMRRSRAKDAFHLLRSLLNGDPFLIARDASAEMSRSVARLTEAAKFDVIHADQLGMAQYAVAARGGRRVLDQHNAVWTIVRRLEENEPVGPRKLFMGMEWRKLQAYEASVCRRFDHIFTVTEQDRRALELGAARHPARGPQQDPPVTVVPICIDPDGVAPVAPNPSAKDIVCVGGMFYPPNVDGIVWFAREVWPLVKRSAPGTRFWIVGARPDKKIRALAAADPQIAVTGYVEDTTSYLRDSAVFIVPLRAGGGMRVKILDAWARGTPTVTTTIGHEGIDVQPGENVLVADAPAAFADAVLRLIRDPQLGRRLSENGRRRVEDKYNWRAAYAEIGRVYASLGAVS